MKKIIFLILFFSLSSFANEDISISEAPLVDELPVNELEFVDTIGLLTPAEVEKILGEPKKIVNITLESSKEVIADDKDIKHNRHLLLSELNKAMNIIANLSVLGT
jgi:glycyl-tRNA synthetase beta subunit